MKNRALGRFSKNSLLNSLLAGNFGRRRVVQDCIHHHAVLCNSDLPARAELPLTFRDFADLDRTKVRLYRAEHAVAAKNGDPVSGSAKLFPARNLWRLQRWVRLSPETGSSLR